MGIADELRKKAEDLRALSAEAAQRHVAASRELAKDLTAAERIALEAEASVADCQARRNRQWATHYEAAAAEVDES